MANNSNIKAQRYIILEHLEQFGRLTTLGAREKLGIMHPASRVQELRKSGIDIITQLSDIDGHPLVATYHLIN